MSEDWPEDAALAELQAVMFEVLARGGSAEEAARALDYPALAAWVRSADRGPGGRGAARRQAGRSRRRLTCSLGSGAL